jgi:hypothetical protein
MKLGVEIHALLGNVSLPNLDAPVSPMADLRISKIITSLLVSSPSLILAVPTDERVYGVSKKSNHSK